MPLITKRMGLPVNTHKTRIIIIKPFHHTFVQNIDPSRVEFYIFLFHNSSICIISKKWSVYCTSSLVCLKDPSISLKILRLIYLFNQKGAPWNIYVVVLDHQLCCEGMPSQQVIYNQHPINLRNLDTPVGYFNCLLVCGITTCLK